MSKSDVKAVGGKATPTSNKGRRLSDAVKNALGQAVAQGRETIVEQLSLCHQAIVEEDEQYPGQDRRDYD